MAWLLVPDARGRISCEMQEIPAEDTGQQRRKRRLGAALTAAALLGAAWLLASRIPVETAQAAAREPAPKVGHPAPDFTLPTPAGQELALSDFRGQVVLLNFWATWCPPCRAEMPALQDAYVQFQDQGFVVLGVDQFETAGQVMGFLERFSITYPQVLDQTGQTSRSYGVFSIPASFFIDREGVIQKVVPGPLNLPQIAAEVRGLLGT